ncbi:MAG: oxidoreductase [Candidatus Eremiobacteraeota bacterium]|nr:oxidoreductase [Candidatus Eremiobacteraeota bacterium]
MVRVGLIGYGFVGQTFHAPLIQSTPELELAVVASSRPDQVQADLPEVEVSTPQALLARPDLDLVVIASPNETHFPLARTALMSGKHVVVDKPFTLDLAEAQELISLTGDRVLSVFHNRRWDSDYLAVRAAIADGLIGRVVHFESHFDRYRPEVRDRWRERQGPGSGVWFDLGPHLLDQALQLLGQPLEVETTLARHRPGAQTDDWAHCLLRYEGCCAVLHASMLVASGSPRFVVHGEKGSLIKRQGDLQEAQLKAGFRPGSEDWGYDPDPLEFWNSAGQMTPLQAPRGCQQAYYAQVRDAVLGRGPNPVTAQQALDVMRILDGPKRTG